MIYFEKDTELDYDSYYRDRYYSWQRNIVCPSCQHENNPLGKYEMRECDKCKTILARNDKILIVKRNLPDPPVLRYMPELKKDVAILVGLGSLIFGSLGYILGVFI